PSFGNTKVKLSKFKEMFYQRENLKYPGKVLAIFPPSNYTQKNSDFLELPSKTTLIEDVIHSEIIKK
ncbi:MAG: peptidase C39, partial [Sulfurovum sp.]